jgi:hypothetical protein
MSEEINPVSSEETDGAFGLAVFKHHQQWVNLPIFAISLCQLIFPDVCEV